MTVLKYGSIAVCILCAVIQVGRSVDETLRLVQAFQYTEEHGEGKGAVTKHPGLITSGCGH